MGERVDRLPCLGLDGLAHRCSARCLPIVARGLPRVVGYRWNYGRTAGGWSIWLEKIGGARGSFHYVLDTPTAATARELVAIVHAFGLGASDYG